MRSTKSRTAEPRGDQRPRVASVPPRVATSGDEAIELANSYGLILDPWQEFLLRESLGERANGKWSAFEVGVLVARQNGKGGFAEARELAGLFLFGERLILHSAHEFKTAQEAFLRTKSYFDNYDSLRKRVRNIRTSHGEEGIELIGGQRLRFVARSRSSGRGFTGDCIFLDECQELSKLAIGALMPTLSARPNPQVIYTGTVPGPLNDAEHFTNIRDRGRAGNDPDLAWFEWNPTSDPVEIANIDVADESLWPMSNPAMGYRISLAHTRRELRSMGKIEFGRERLSLWPDGDAGAAIPAKSWADCEDPDSGFNGDPMFGIDVPRDRSHAAIGCAGLRDDGPVHVEIVEYKRGTDWVVERMGELIDEHGGKVVVDPGSTAGSLLADLEEAGIPVMTTAARDYAQACGQFYDAVVQGRLRHMGDLDLDIAVAGTTKRDLGDAWAWNRKNPTVDISPLVAVTLAAWGLPASVDIEQTIW